MFGNHLNDYSRLLQDVNIRRAQALFHGRAKGPRPVLNDVCIYYIHKATLALYSGDVKIVKCITMRTRRRRGVPMLSYQHEQKIFLSDVELSVFLSQ